jgi:hypothetical protein
LKSTWVPLRLMTDFILLIRRASTCKGFLFPLYA